MVGARSPFAFFCGFHEQRLDLRKAALRAIPELPLEPAPFRVPCLDQAPPRTLQLLDLAPDLRLEVNIRDRDPRGGCHRLQQLRIRNEIGVVNERRHFDIAVADDSRPTLAVVRGQRQLAAFLVAVDARVDQPVSQLE